MSEGVIVAIITIALGGVVSAATTAWLKRLNRNHDQAVTETIVSDRMTKELERVYGRLEKFEAKVAEQADKIDSLERAVDIAERRADASDLRADRAEFRADRADRVADVARENATALLVHIGALEELLPPPPPVRPVLRLTEEPRD